jgi:very-long-chain (3R)-3-hydroxyacyl-CoA dehydratase
MAVALSPKYMYLIAYNAICCVGWAVVFAGSLKTLFLTDDLEITMESLVERLSNVYGPVADVLAYVQTAALLEILHAGIGWVRSPVLVTAMQVSSRIFALVAIRYAPAAQGKSDYRYTFFHKTMCSIFFVFEKSNGVVA